MPTFYERFQACAQKWPDNVALQFQTRAGLESYTYAEVRHLSESIAHWLLSCGYSPGTRCAILAANHPRWVTAFLGTIAAGCVATPLDTALDAQQITKLLHDSGSSLLFTDDKHLCLARQAVQTSSCPTRSASAPQILMANL
ncbi:MAG: AMP-binding protein, partial [Acidobacteria bacterium]|nr:AMP-binding protein [Acidobacteriota bacterium]